MASSPDAHGVLLAQRSLAYIAAGKNGLAEDELVAVLSADADVMSEFLQRHPDSPSVDALPFLIWARLHDDLAPYLRYLKIDGTQTVSFFHAQFEQVVDDDLLGAAGPVFHEALARYFAALPRTTVVDGQIRPCLRPLAELPFQWARAGRWIELDRLLMDFDFLQTKLTAFGTQSLIEDLNLALAVDGRRADGTSALTALRDTLVLASDLLREHPQQLAPQLHARLGQSGDALIESLLAAARPAGTGCWLRPARRSQPDIRGPLTATIRLAEGSVEAVAATPHSTIVAAACDCMVEVWDFATLEPVRRIGPIDTPFSRGSRLHMLADGDTVIALPRYGPIAAYRISSGERAWTLGEPEDRFAELSVSADEHRLVAGNSGQVVLWDLTSRAELWRIDLPREPKGQKRPVLGRQFRSIGITADGQRIVAAQFNGPIGVWNVTRRRFERHLKGCPEEVNAFAAGTSPTRIFGFAAAHYSKLDAMLHQAPGIQNNVDLFTEDVERIYVRHVLEWDTATGKILVDRRFSDEVGVSNGLAVVRSANRLASASNGGPIDLLGMDAAAAPVSLSGHEGSALDVSLVGDGTQIVSCGQDGTLKRWDVAKALTQRPATSHLAHVMSASFASDGGLCATVSLDDSIIVWHRRDRFAKPVRHQTGYGIQAIHLLPDGRRAFAVCYDKRCRIIDLHTFEAHVVHRTEYVERMLGSAVSPDGRLAAVAWQIEDVSVEGATFTFGFDLLDLTTGTVRHHDRSGDRTESLAGDLIAFSANSDRVVISAGSWTCVSSTATGAVLARHRTPGVTAHVLAPDGKHVWQAIATGIQALDLKSGTCVEIARGEYSIEAMAYSHTTRQLVTASRRRVVSLWDAVAWVPLASFWGDAEITACAVAPGGDVIVAGDALGNVHVLEPLKSRSS